MLVKVIQSKFNKFGIVPKWIILSLDLALIIFSFFISLIFIGKLNISLSNSLRIFITSIILTIVNYSIFNYFKTYSGIVRYTGIQDASRIMFAISVSSTSFYLITKILNLEIDNYHFDFYFISSFFFEYNFLNML